MKCIKCKETYDDDFKFCPYCGEKKPAPKICPNCKLEPKIEFNFCPKCGTELIEKEKIAEWKEKKEEEEKVMEKVKNILIDIVKIGEEERLKRLKEEEEKEHKRKIKAEMEEEKKEWMKNRKILCLRWKGEEYLKIKDLKNASKCFNNAKKIYEGISNEELFECDFPWKQKRIDAKKEILEIEKNIQLIEKLEFENKYKFCPKCNHRLNIVAKKCPYCDYKF